MGQRKILAGAAAVLAAGLAMSACSPAEKTDNTTSGNINTESSVSVMWNQPFYSANTLSNTGNATANNNIVYLTNDSLTYYDADLKLQPNKSFGSYEKTSDNPLTVKVTLADTATWSDGVPVSAADIILTYGASSGIYNTIKNDEDIQKLYDAEGNLKKVGGNRVYFESNSPSLQLIKQFPEVSADGKTVTYTYSKPFADWEPSVLGPSAIPAHILAKRALGISDPTQANQAIIDAFKNKDNEKLAKLANAWNLDWNFTKMPSDKDLVVSSGPYQMSEFTKEYMTLVRNPNYKGEHKPTIDKMTIRYNEDPNAAVQALENNEVQVISPQSSADILSSVQKLQNVTVKTGFEGTYEHIDLTFNNKGPFDPATYGGNAEKALKVRQAFLYTVPREKIVNDIIKPLNPDATIRQSYNVVPGAPTYDATIAANNMASYTTDVAKAKQLLSEAGVSSPKVRIMYGASNQRRQDQFTLIKESAEKAGFNIVAKATDDWGTKLGDKSYDAALFGWQSVSTAITEPQANYITGGNNDFGGYSNKKVDALYTELMTTTDPARQQEINIEVEKQLVADAFGLTIFQFPGVTAYSNSVQNIEPITLAPTIFWNFWEWKLA